MTSGSVMKQRNLEDLRPQLRRGDVLVSKCSDLGSRLACIVSGDKSSVSHCGLVLSKEFYIEAYFSFDRAKGSGIWIRRIDDYLHREESVWCLRLATDVRRSLELERGNGFLFSTAALRRYSLLKALRLAVVRALGSGFSRQRRGCMEIPRGNMTCSELLAGFFRACGVADIQSCSFVLPVDISRWGMFDPVYYQLKGDRQEIAGFNTLPVGTLALA